jgi:peptide-methionine (S)-S-oxide reductase
MNKINTFLFMSAMAICMAACAQSPTQQKKNTQTQKDLSKYSKAVFAAGCFWHEEALYDGIKGVQEAVSGYAGGDVENPNYEMVSTGETGHAESVMVYYDSTLVSYATLLKAYFEAQDPTSVNGQGADRGTQYRSIAFYNNEQQKQQIEEYIKQLNASGRYDKPIAVIVMPYSKFWNAEDYHQEYVVNHPNSNYVQNVCVKEVKIFQKKFPELIKPDRVLKQ